MQCALFCQPYYKRWLKITYMAVSELHSERELQNPQVHVVDWPSNNFLSSQLVMQSLVYVAVKSAEE